METDLTIACTVFLPEGAVLADDKQTFLLKGGEFVLNTVTFSSMVDNNATPIIIDLTITDVADTSFEEVID